MAQTRRVEMQNERPQRPKRRGFRPAVMDGARTSWLVQRFYRRAYLVAGPLPKIAMDHSQLPLGRMVGLLAYRNYGRLRLRHTECVQYECTLHRIFFQTIEAPAFTHVSSAHIGVE
jgi:hypothetical protein